MIALARHGETTWNVAGRYQGRLESPLSDLGLRQARALAGWFEERRRAGNPIPERIVTSPLSRCTETAAFVADALGIESSLDERLIEIDHGTWSGLHRDEVAASDAERLREWREHPAQVVFPNGERLDDVLARWQSFAGDLRENTLVVTHDAVLRCALLDVQRRPLDNFWNLQIENGAFAMLHRDGSHLRVDTECVYEHLKAVRSDAHRQAL